MPMLKLYSFTIIKSKAINYHIRYLEFVHRFPLYSFTTCWNELDPSLSYIASKNEFEYELKLHFWIDYRTLNAAGYFAILVQL